MPNTFLIYFEIRQSWAIAFVAKFRLIGLEYHLEHICCYLLKSMIGLDFEASGINCQLSVIIINFNRTGKIFIDKLNDPFQVADRMSDKLYCSQLWTLSDSKSIFVSCAITGPIYIIPLTQKYNLWNVIVRCLPNVNETPVNWHLHFLIHINWFEST